MRTKPIRRDEIRYCWDIETMPASGMRKGEPITKLWAPLLRDLDQERRRDWESWVEKGISSADDPPEPISVPHPYCLCRCRHCGTRSTRPRGAWDTTAARCSTVQTNASKPPIRCSSPRPSRHARNNVPL